MHCTIAVIHILNYRRAKMKFIKEWNEYVIGYILRLGIYEILWAADIPDSVAIDEALSLAKELSTDESSGFIHGVLGRISSLKENLSL